MGEWRKIALSEVVDLIGGGTPKTSIAEYWDGDIPWLSVADFNTGRKYVHDAEKCITQLGLAKSSTKLLQEGDIIISARGTVGIVAILGRQMAFNQSCYGVRAKEDETQNNYVFYLLKEVVDNLQQISHGGVFDTITRDTFKEIDISLPPLPEQKAIAAVLSSLDDKIDLLHRQNKTLEAMAETLFRQWFVEEALEGWEERKLGELLTITSSKRIFYKEYVSTGIPFYRSKEIIELHNSGSTKSDLFITEERFNEIIEKFGAPVEGDILLTSVGTLGIPYRVKRNDKFYFKDGNLTWFKNFTGISSIIIYIWLKSNIGKEQLDAITIGSTQSALTISGLKEISLRIPPTGKLKELESYLRYINNKIDFNHAQIRTLEKLRDTLLPKLMSGEVRVQYNKEATA